MLIDSGASGNFITKKFLSPGRETLNGMISIMEPKSVKLANGSTIKTNRIIHNVNTNVKNKTLPCTFVILPELNNQYDAILGMPYLASADPDISFSQKTFNWLSEHPSSKTNLKPCNAELGNLKLSSIQSKLNNKIQLFKQKRHVKQQTTLAGIEINTNCLNRHLKIEPGDNFFLTNIRDLTAYPPAAKENTLSLNEICVEKIIPTLHPQAQKLVTEFIEVFPEELPKKLPKRQIEHRIDLISGAKPVSQPIYRMSDNELKELKRQIDDLLHHGFIRPSLSPYGSPVLFVKTKDGSMRLCIDYRRPNDITIKNSFGLPRADEQLESVRGAKYFTKLYLHFWI